MTLNGIDCLDIAKQLMHNQQIAWSVSMCVCVCVTLCNYDQMGSEYSVKLDNVHVGIVRMEIS